MRNVKDAGFAKSPFEEGGKSSPFWNHWTNSEFNCGDSVTICDKAGTAIAMDRLGNLQLT